nr:winged helix-turn-helix transcriptional regulator [Ktedonosporobacter rubrisoli]
MENGKQLFYIIYWKLLDASNELKRLLPDISQRILTQQLRELEHDGIVHREIYKEIPPRVEYWLTDFGTSLKPIIMVMLDWGDQYLERFAGTRVVCEE